MERSQHLFDLSVFLVVDFLATHTRTSLKYIALYEVLVSHSPISQSTFGVLALARFIAFCAFQSLSKICDKFFGGLLHLQYVAKSFIISRATLQICFARINHCAHCHCIHTHTLCDRTRISTQHHQQQQEQQQWHHHHCRRRRRCGRHYDMTSNSNSTANVSYIIGLTHTHTMAKETFDIKWRERKKIRSQSNENKRPNGNSISSVYVGFKGIRVKIKDTQRRINYELSLTSKFN